MAVHRILVVDVFSATPLFGNPVAVIVNADGMDDATMQRIAAWTNLSETTFLLPPTRREADYRVRIFTPRSELPFAGHPSLGTAHAARMAAVVSAAKDTLRQECGVGVLPLRVDAEQRVWVQAPRARVEAVRDDTAAALSTALGAPATGVRLVDVGASWVVARLADEAAVRGLRPDLAAVAQLTVGLGASAGVTVFTDGSPLVVRSFAPACGVPEDPVCGSGNAAVAAARLDAGEVAAPVAWHVSQGREVGRDGTVFVDVGRDGTTWVGGRTVTVSDGTLRH